MALFCFAEQLSEQEKVVIPVKKPDVNKWDGEDEEEDVKVSSMRFVAF